MQITLFPVMILYTENVLHVFKRVLYVNEKDRWHFVWISIANAWYTFAQRHQCMWSIFIILVYTKVEEILTKSIITKPTFPYLLQKKHSIKQNVVQFKQILFKNNFWNSYIDFSWHKIFANFYPHSNFDIVYRTFM